MTESRSVAASGMGCKRAQGACGMMEVFSVFVVAVALQLCTTVTPIGLCTLNGCSLLYLH